jgi:MFS family permease
MELTKIRPYYNLAIGFVTQNVAVGLTFGCFGLIIDPVARDLGGGRSVISWSVGLILLLYGLLGPLTGLLLDRWSVAKTIVLGCLVGAVGFYFSAHATTAMEFTLSFGLIVGAGHTLMGVIPATKLANVWFPNSRGRATGFANVPLLIGIGPPIFAYVLLFTGWRGLLQDFAVVFACIALLGLFVSVPKGAGATGLSHSGAAKSANATARQIVPYRHKVFWIICVGKGMLVSSGIVAVTYLVSYGIDNGISRGNASLLLSVFGIAASFGALLYGWMCDRLTPFIALTINASLQCLLWILIICFPKFAPLVLLTAGMSLCTGGVATVAMTMLGRAMPAHVFGTALGQMMFAIIPFTFLAAPVAGALRDWRGNYLPAFLLEAGLCGLCVLYLFYFRKNLQCL